MTACLSFAAPAVARHKVDEAVATANPELAAQAHSWNPLAVDPLLTEAALEDFDGRPLEGAAAVPAGDRHAARESAGVGRARRCSSSTLCGDPCGAYRSLSRAYELDRYNRAVAFDGGPLDVARARAKKRGCA